MVNFNFIDPSDNPLWYFLSFRKGRSISFQLAHYYLELDDNSSKFYLPIDISTSTTKAWVATDVSLATRSDPINPLEISNNIFDAMPAYSIFTNENWHRIDININLPFDLASWVLISGIGSTRSGNSKYIFDNELDFNTNTDDNFQFKIEDSKSKKFPWFIENGDYQDIVKNIAIKLRPNISNNNLNIYIPFGLDYDLDYSTTNKIKYYRVTKNDDPIVENLDIDYEFGYNSFGSSNNNRLFSIDLDSYV